MIFLTRHTSSRLGTISSVQKSCEGMNVGANLAHSVTGVRSTKLTSFVKNF